MKKGRKGDEQINQQSKTDRKKRKTNKGKRKEDKKFFFIFF